MSFDDVLKLIAALGLGSVGGTIAGGISGGISALWKSRHDKQQRLDDTRRERLATWRAELRDPEKRKGHITAIPSWPEIRSFLEPDTVKEAEKPSTIMVGGPAIAVMPNWSKATPQTVVHRTMPWDEVLDQLAELERTWGLI